MDQAIQRAIRANLATYGWHTQINFDCQREQTDIAYTIGMSATLGHELIVSGLRGRMAHEMFIILWTEWLPEHHGRIPLGKPVTDLATLPTLFMSCDPDLLRPHIEYATDYFQRDVPYVQLVLPDRQGRFPSDPQFDHAHMDKLQTLLFHTYN